MRNCEGSRDQLRRIIKIHPFVVVGGNESDEICEQLRKTRRSFERLPRASRAIRFAAKIFPVEPWGTKFQNRGCKLRETGQQGVGLSVRIPRDVTAKTVLLGRPAFQRSFRPDN